jgi:hypothetical protein
MAGRHQKPEPPMPGTPWYLWILLAPPLLSILFVLAGWWPHYRAIPIAAGLATSALSAVMGYRKRRTTTP